MPLSSIGCGLAQASHAMRSISVIVLATRKVISVEVMGAADMDIWIAILGPKPLEDHLVGPTRRALPVAVAAHRPGQQRQAAEMTCRERQRGRQILDRIRDELRMRHERIAAI